MSAPNEVIKSNSGFNIHSKLLSQDSHWSYAFLVQKHQDNSKYELRTTLVDTIEFAIYKRDGHYMLLVDFFTEYDDACEEAKSILDSFPKAKKTVDAWSNCK